MLFLKGLVLSLLPVLASAAKKPTVDKFERYNTKAQISTPLKLDDASYAGLTATPRDYSVAILLTALDNRFGCQLCREFQPEWELLSKSWTRGDKKAESRLIYGTLDFTDGKSTFQSVSTASARSTILANVYQLGLQTAPVLLLFLPTTGPHAAKDAAPQRYDFTSG